MGPGRFAGVGLVGTLKGIIVAIIVSIVALAYQVADPPAYVLGMPGTNLFRQRAKEYPEDETIPGLLMLRLEGRFFFVNASQIAQKIKPLIEEFQPKVGAIHLSGVPDLEHRVENADRGRSATARPWHGRRAGGNEPPSATDGRKSQFGQILGRDAMLFNLEIAVAKYQNTFVTAKWNED